VSQLYDDLAKLDRGIADRWKARSKDNPAHVITDADVEAIVFPLLLKDKSISELQAEAIMHLIVTPDWTDPALGTLRIYVELADKYSLFDDNAAPLTTDVQLKPVFTALAMDTIGRIIFKSPKSGISYGPHDYLAIKNLIKNSKVTVLEVKLHGLEGFGVSTAGKYKSDRNTLFLYDETSPAFRINTVVHETTHAAQDWRDVRILHKYAEADAYVAGAVSDRSRGTGEQTKTGEIFDAAFKAAKFVMEHDTEATNKDWIGAYEAVVHAVEKSQLYKSVKNVPMETKDKGEADNEKGQMAALVRAIDQERNQRVRYAPGATRTRHTAVRGRAR
jgi:hypothetical protein